MVKQISVVSSLKSKLYAHREAYYWYITLNWTLYPENFHFANFTTSSEFSLFETMDIKKTSNITDLILTTSWDQLVSFGGKLTDPTRLYHNQTWSILKNQHKKPSRIDSISFRFRFVPIRFEVSKSRFVIDYFNFDFGIYTCMFSEKLVTFRYYRNVTDSYRKKVMTIKITDVYNKQI